MYVSTHITIQHLWGYLRKCIHPQLCTDLPCSNPMHIWLHEHGQQFKNQPGSIWRRFFDFFKPVSCWNPVRHSKLCKFWLRFGIKTASRRFLNSDFYATLCPFPKFRFPALFSGLENKDAVLPSFWLWVQNLTTTITSKTLMSVKTYLWKIFIYLRRFCYF